MTLFDHLAAAAQSVITAVGGEEVTLVPMTLGAGMNGHPTVDAARQEITMRAVFSERLESFVASDAFDPRSDNRMRNAGPVLTALLRVSGLAWVPRANDRIRRPATGQIYQISSPPEGDGHGNVVLRLALAKE